MTITGRVSQPESGAGVQGDAVAAGRPIIVGGVVLSYAAGGPAKLLINAHLLRFH